LRARLPRATLAATEAALFHGLQRVYLALACLAVVGIAIAWMFPGGSAQSLAHSEAALGPEI
jgi:hypothetical protein